MRSWRKLHFRLVSVNWRHSRNHVIFAKLSRQGAFALIFYFPLSQAILFSGGLERVFWTRQLKTLRSVAVERPHHVIERTGPSEQQSKSRTIASVSTATDGQLWCCISSSYEPRSLSSASTKYSTWESCLSSSPVLRQFLWTANTKSIWPELSVSHASFSSSSKLSSTKLGGGFPRLGNSLPW